MADISFIKLDPLAFCQMFPKSMKDAYTSKCILILTKYSLKINAVFVKGFNTQHIFLAMIEKMKHHEIINNFVQLF